MNGQAEKKGTKWITLLYSFCRLKDTVMPEKGGGRRIG